MITIEVAGQKVPNEELHRYVVRFWPSSSGPFTALYFDGRRVVDAYKVVIEDNQPKDPHGRSA